MAIENIKLYVYSIKFIVFLRQQNQKPIAHSDNCLVFSFFISTHIYESNETMKHDTFLI